MASGPEQHTRTLERLSAVMDGEADEAAVVSACAAWRDGDSDRATWYAWHLVGDVMRSDDLASSASRDADFLSTFRAKLEDEPVVLAPSVVPEKVDVVREPQVAQAFVSTVSSVRRRRAWTASAAVAAGFVAVAGAVLVLQRPAASPPQTIAQATPAAAPQPGVLPVVSVSKPVAADPIAVPVSNGQMIRDARLQQYLAAHKQFGGATALGVPSGFLRSATVETPGR